MKTPGYLIVARIGRASIVPCMTSTGWVELSNGLSTVLMGEDVVRDL